MVRGELFHLPASRSARGHEQRGARYAVVVQADEFLDLSTVLVAPTSTRARAASFRPTIALDGQETRVLVEQTSVVDPQQLGCSAGRLEVDELRSVEEALALVLGPEKAGVSGEQFRVVELALLRDDVRVRASRCHEVVVAGRIESFSLKSTPVPLG